MNLAFTYNEHGPTNTINSTGTSPKSSVVGEIYKCYATSSQRLTKTTKAVLCAGILAALLYKRTLEEVSRGKK